MASDQPHDSWRAASGRFGPGNPGGPGGARRRPDYRRAIEEAVSPEHAGAVIRKALRLALEGDIKAMVLVLNRLAGRPAEAPEDAVALDLTIQGLHTADACREAIEAVLASITQGKVNRSTGEVVLGGIRTCLDAIEARQRGPDGQPDSLSLPPISTDELRAHFRRFQRTGELPTAEHEAAAVIAKVKAGFALVPCQSSALTGRTDEFVPRPRGEDPAMDGLLQEAAFGSTLEKILARHFLRCFADADLDVTAPQLEFMNLPEFWSVGMMLAGFPDRLVRRPYTQQALRLLDRIEAVRTRVPRTQDAYRAWQRKVDRATVALQLSGELPDSEGVLNYVLVLGELTSLFQHFAGEDVRDAMKLFDDIAQGSGEVRSRALAQLAAMGRSGDLVSPKERPSAGGAARLKPTRPPCAGPRRRGACRPER